MSKGLTSRQSEIYNFIEEYINENSYPPTLKEIGQHFSISLKGSYDHIKALQKKKYIDYEAKKSRSIKLLVFSGSNKENVKRTNLMEIPLLGTVQAGLPILSHENYDTTIKVDKDLFKCRGELFALKVRGDSMIDVGINEDDIALVKVVNDFENGEIIVAQTEDGITIKKGYKEERYLKLVPANKNYEPIITKNMRIIGKLIGIIRKY